MPRRCVNASPFSPRTWLIHSALRLVWTDRRGSSRDPRPRAAPAPPALRGEVGWREAACAADGGDAIA